MEVNSVYKTLEGFVKFQGTLSQEEADYVIGMGLNILMQKGALNIEEQEDGSVAPNIQ